MIVIRLMLRPNPADVYPECEFLLLERVFNLPMLSPTPVIRP